MSALALTLAAGAVPAQPLEPAEPSDRGPAGAAPAPVPMPSDSALAPFELRPIREVRLLGISENNRQYAENQIRSRTGQPLSIETVRGDVQRLTRLGRFDSIEASVQGFDDGTVALVYLISETPIIYDVEAVGNRQIADQDLAAVISLLKGTPVDEYQLGAAANAIRKLYRDRGYYNAQVGVTREPQPDGSVVVLFEISEGERLRVTDIRFVGNEAFPARQVRSAIKTKEAGLFESGPVDNEVLDQDVAAVIGFYRDRGYLDVRADRRLIFSPNGREAIVEFLIDEGPVYTLRSVRAELSEGGPRTGEPPRVFSAEQLAGLMLVKPGDVFGVDKIDRSLDTVRNAYAKMGYADARVTSAELRDPERPVVDLLLIVREGERFKTGLVEISGNDLTQDKVARQQLLELRPDRPLDTSFQRRAGQTVTTAQLRLEETRLFEPGSIKITVQPPVPANPGYRDVLVEVEETNTGSLSFGAGASSDAGVFGIFRLSQKNFNPGDVPDSFGELLTGRAFRGAGQQFDLEAAPGNEVQTFSVSLSDPSLFDTDYTGSGTLFFRNREFDDFETDFNERRYGARLSLGRRFGERWVGSVFGRYENVRISDVDSDSPQDLFDVEGEHDLTGLGVQLQRTTVDSRFRPTRGTRVELSAERIGAVGGDYDFTRLSTEYQLYIPIDEDFLGYTTVLSLKSAVGYIPESEDEAPMFERFYLGGRSFRGFRYRTISPKGLTPEGVLTEDPVGGTWSFYLGTELEKPLWRDLLAGVVFVDSGTVTNDVGFEDYRVSAGFGFRLYIQQLGPVPLAFDFGFPIVKYFGDRERVFSFSVDLPF